MGSIGPTEIILVLLVLVLLFGARKLPELARGSGRALRIFKAETKGLTDDDEKEQQATDDAPQQQPRQQLPPSPPSQTANGTESSDSNRASRDQQQS
jgi:sec-independent protein translocase protein TatA